jgi:hypothetical protein
MNLAAILRSSNHADNAELAGAGDSAIHREWQVYASAPRTLA